MTGKKALAKRAADEAVEKQFSNNRLQINSMERSERQKLIEKGLISRSMMDRILDKNVADASFQRLNKASVNEAIRNLNVFDIPAAIAELIGKTEKGGRNTLSKLHERYRYFRFAAASSDSTNIELVEGQIRMQDVSGNACFEHRSHNWGISNLNPEHTGYIFRSQAFIYMLGFGEGLIRLAIGNMPFSRATELISGIVLSKRSDGPYEPFAARFLMVPESNAGLIAQLRDRDLKYPERLHDWKDNPQKREDVFFSYVKSDENFHILYHPLKSKRVDSGLISDTEGSATNPVPSIDESK